MRQLTIEKPKPVKTLAHAFTSYACEYQAMPVFRISPRMYASLIATPAEYVDQVHIVGITEAGGYGTMFGVEFAMVHGQTDEVVAVDTSDAVFGKVKAEVLKEVA